MKRLELVKRHAPVHPVDPIETLKTVLKEKNPTVGTIEHAFSENYHLLLLEAGSTYAVLMQPDMTANALKRIDRYPVRGTP
jgi:hypothetical protein